MTKNDSDSQKLDSTTPAIAHTSQPIGKLRRIVSGGQTGVDRAALDIAIEMGMEHGGWCPRGRIAEDGTIPSHYALKEMDSDQYSDRTKRNIIDSDGTLVLYASKLEGGTLMTVRYAQRIGKPFLKIKLAQSNRIQRVCDWLVQNKIQTLNVAGPRASKEPEVYGQAQVYLRKILTRGLNWEKHRGSTKPRDAESK